MTYPTFEQVEKADQYTLCMWHRFLPSPTTDEQVKLNQRMWDRWSEGGGFTPEISKSIGWGAR